MNREDFNILRSNIIYFDSAATSLKPKCLSETLSDYYDNYSANAKRGDYDMALKVNVNYEKTRNLIKEFLNAKSNNEIIFTTGTTDSLNKVIFGYFKNNLNKDDEVLVTRSEHASNLLPWFELQDEIGIKVKYIELDENLEVLLENIKKITNKNTKVISIAHITNVIGDVRNIKEITKYAHENNILTLIDGAQSVAHTKTDVMDLDIDFLTFSAHKMLGPTGVGVLYGKEKLLRNIRPTVFGGGMNASFSENGTRVYDEIPELLEAGTPNIAGIIAFGKIIEYLNKIGMENIEKYEQNLKKYAIDKLKKVPNIIIYNEKSNSGIITINIKDIFAQDLAIYLNKYNICVRSGSHCSKLIKEELKIKNTCRISLYFYNTKEEIDKLIMVLSNENIKNEII